MCSPGPCSGKEIEMLEEVFVLQHLNELPSGAKASKLIGYYTTKALAQAALDRTRPLPGFCDVPDGFVLRVMRVDEDSFSNPA